MKMKTTVVAIYALVAFLDILTLVLFFGPSVLGISLRWIPGFDDYLPLMAISLLKISAGLLLFAAAKAVRDPIFSQKSTLACYFVILAYVIISGAVLLLVETGKV